MTIDVEFFAKNTIPIPIIRQHFAHGNSPDESEMQKDTLGAQQCILQSSCELSKSILADRLSTNGVIVFSSVILQIGLLGPLSRYEGARIVRTNGGRSQI